MLPKSIAQAPAPYSGLHIQSLDVRLSACEQHNCINLFKGWYANLALYFVVQTILRSDLDNYTCHGLLQLYCIQLKTSKR